ncbi:MAG: HAMP domain-containing histidine kinase, partial [Acidobacteriaceae bacterium]|nr:HAMP domain-containing histidine kinase [Acidobacteriaceae bacterium]
SISVPEDIELVSDRTRLERVFANLIANAAEAMPGGGEIRIYSTENTEYLKVMVEDNGPGLAQEVRAQLFRPFFSAGKRSGLGLGLALSRQTMLSLGGDLYLVETGTPGACFCIQFPKSAVKAGSENTVPNAVLS